MDGDVPAAPTIEARALAPLAGPAGFTFHDPCVLGTRLNVVVDAANQAAAFQAACAARVAIDALDRVFNWREAASEISRLNRSARHQASAELFAVVTAAEQWRAISEGAYSGRLGRLLAAWRAAGDTLPDRAAMARLAGEIAAAEMGLDHSSRTITRPDVVQFDLDGIAKGYIIDRALEAAMAIPGVARAMVDIGGDVRCAGGEVWRIDLPAPLLPFDNARACGGFALEQGAVATSGCGPRDARIGGEVLSATLDPRNGWPVAHRLSATAVASTAMDADALATMMLVLPKDAVAACIRRTAGMAGRVTRPGGVDWFSSLQGAELQSPPQWIDYEPQSPAKSTPAKNAPTKNAPTLWSEGWHATVTFSAPPKDMQREIAFRSPYVAIWVSDADDKPVRTLFLVGRYKEWHEGNHVWWRQNRAKLDKIFGGRSLSTRGSGTYKVYWDGIDDEDRPVAPGRYRIHVETSREGGGHSHRVIDLDFSKPKTLNSELPMQVDNGGLEVAFEKF